MEDDGMIENSMGKRRWGFFHLQPALFAVAAALLLTAPVQAGDIRPVCLAMDIFTPLERTFFEDLADGGLNGYDDYDAFLIASGIVEPRAFSRYRPRMRAIRSRAMASVNRNAAPYGRGKALLFWLHDNVPRTYVETSNLAGDLLDRGAFNCLSSTILYCLLAKDLGRTSFDDLEVQYYNQVARQQVNAGDFNGAVQTLWAALRLYPENPVLDNNILYYYGLWADTFRARSDTGGVVRVFLAARQMLPDSAAVLESLKIAFYNHAVDAYNRQDFDAARAVCQEALGLFPGEGAFLEILDAIPQDTPAWQWGR